jgi:hypothetical protein
VVRGRLEDASAQNGSPLWEGEAPAEPKEVVSSQWSVVSQNVARASLPGDLLPTQSRQRCMLARHSAIPCADDHSAKDSLGIVTELVLGGPRGVPREGEAPAEPNNPFVRARLPPNRSQPSLFAHNPDPVIPARSPLPHTKPRPTTHLPFTHPSAALTTTAQRPHLDTTLTLVLSRRSMGFSPCSSPHSSPPRRAVNIRRRVF